MSAKRSKKERTQIESSSSSIRQFGRSEDAGATVPATTTVDVNDKSQPKPAPWSDGDRDQAREAMRSHFGALMLPDLDLTREVLLHMEGPDDVHLGLSDLTDRRVKIKSWGFYQHDAQNWPSRRADVKGQVDAQRMVMEAEARSRVQTDAAAIEESEAALAEGQLRQQIEQEFIEAATAKGWPRMSKLTCPDCYGFGRRDVETGEICDCESGRKLAQNLERCRRCSNTGIVAAAGNSHESAWCECVHAIRRREREPGLVDDANQTAQNLGLGVSAKPSDPRPTQRPSRERHLHGNRRASR